MKKLFRPLLLLSLLTITPVVLTGCGGGSSSNRSSSQTRADFTFSDVVSPFQFRPLRVNRALRSPLPDFAELKGNGVYTFFLRPSVELEGLTTITVSEKNGDRYALLFMRNGVGTESPTEGTVYDLATAGGGNFAERKVKGGTSVIYSSKSGTITVTGRSGSLVTLTFANVLFESENKDQRFTLAGTMTYDLANAQTVGAG